VRHTRPRRWVLRYSFLVLLVPVVTEGGVSYDLTSRPLPGSAAPTVVRYFVEQGIVRVGAPEAPRVELFKDGAIYFIDNSSKSVTVLRNATLARVQQGLAEQVKKMEDMASQAPPDERAKAEEAATVVREIYKRQRAGVPREFRITTRTETAASGTCRIWEMFEQGIKRLELCVAPTQAITGGEDILLGMKILCGYLHGSAFALGAEFGTVDIWPRIEALGGLPVMVREFKEGVAVSETTVTGERQIPTSPQLFEVPADYLRKEGPRVAPK